MVWRGWICMGVIPMSDDGFNPSDLLINDDGDGVVSRVTSFLGIQKEAYVCPECNTVCEEAMTYNPASAAFDGGRCPCWRCESCGREFVRERDDSGLSLDLYGRE